MLSVGDVAAPHCCTLRGASGRSIAQVSPSIGVPPARPMLATYLLLRLMCLVTLAHSVSRVFIDIVYLLDLEFWLRDGLGSLTRG